MALNHICACIYGPDGLCIWCHSTVDSKFHGQTDATVKLPASQPLGTTVRRAAVPWFNKHAFGAQTCRTVWARYNMVKSAEEIIGKSLTDVEAETEKLAAAFSQRVASILARR